MESTEQGGSRDDSVVGDVAAVFEVMQRLLRGKSLDPGVEGIDITVGDDGTGVAYGKCVVKIKADSAASRDKIKEAIKSTGEGWTCTDKPGSTTESTCTNP